MNPLLQKVESAVIGNLNPPALRPAVDRIVAAGKKIMYSPQTRAMVFKQLGVRGDPAEVIGAGIAKLLGMLFSQSHNTIPMEAGIPAATLLLCEGLGFLEDAGKIQVDLPMFEQCMQATASAILQLFGITPERVQQAVASQRMAGAAPGR